MTHGILVASVEYERMLHTKKTHLHSLECFYKVSALTLKVLVMTIDALGCCYILIMSIPLSNEIRLKVS